MNDVDTQVPLSADDTRQAELATSIVSDILAGAGLDADVSFSQEDRDILIDVSGHEFPDL